MKIVDKNGQYRIAIRDKVRTPNTGATADVYGFVMLQSKKAV